MSKKNVLVTGAAGFIGPQVVRLFLEKNFHVVVLDKLTYAGNTRNLEMVIDEVRAIDADVDHRYEFIHGDICDLSVKGLIESRDISWFVNLAAESHVDRSIGGAPEFLKTEVQGTLNLLEIIRSVNDGETPQVEKALFVGTDEVYGSIDRISGVEGEGWYKLTQDEAELSDHIQQHLFKEAHRLQPGSPYASTKAGADLLILSYVNTYGTAAIPVRITRGVNNFGPFQHPEKLLPLAICTLLKPNGRRIPVYDRGLAVREWLHTVDHAHAIWSVLENGDPGEIYNVGSGQRCLNRDILIAVFKAIQEVSETEFTDLKAAAFDATGARPGHDFCYAADASQLRSLGWQPKYADLAFEIRRLVEWYANHRNWWEPIWDSPEFETYWQSKYGAKLQAFGDAPFDFYNDTHWNRPLSAALL